ncbi:helix-turn-helix transcriptional regulator [Tenacibaculum sp. TC6]|uniref:helix-turn-helix transcriptional regulator n=1 Tax=Tenacibaculum sp. TC6 TaxID=3423223 RepID=UPI003D36102D
MEQLKILYKPKNKLFLTEIQFSIILLLVSGNSVKEVSILLNKPHATVKAHIEKIKKKHQLKRLIDLVRDFVLVYGNPKKYFLKN